MTKKEFDPLSNVSISRPCPASWDGISGDNRSRLCSKCDKQVYNLAAMTEEEVRQLIADREE
jgi:hypothetical protein